MSFDVMVTSWKLALRGGTVLLTQQSGTPSAYRPHLLEPASTGLFVQQAKEKIEIGDATSFLPIPPPGQTDLMNSTARLYMYCCFLQLLRTFAVFVDSQLLSHSFYSDLVSIKHLNKFGHVPIQPRP